MKTLWWRVAPSPSSLLSDLAHFVTVPYDGGMDMRSKPRWNYPVPPRSIESMIFQGNRFMSGTTEDLHRHRPLPKTAVERQRLANRLASSPGLNTEQRNTLIALGHGGFPLLIKQSKTARGERLLEVLTLLAKIAGPADTPAILALYQSDLFFEARISSNPFEGVSEHPLRAWLRDVGDPKMIARTFLPEFSAADSQRKALLLPFLIRNQEKSVVDRLFAILQDPTADLNLRSPIYKQIAASKRPDVLAWLLKNRNSERRLSKPNPDMSKSSDRDQDGIPDAFDVNPDAAKPPTSDSEQVLATAFECSCHFFGKGLHPCYVTYPKGIAPFELYGWDGSVLPSAIRPPPFPHKNNDLGQWDFTTVAFDVVKFKSLRLKDGSFSLSAEVDSGMSSAPLSGGGTRFILQKIHGHWFVVSAAPTWIS